MIDQERRGQKRTRAHFAVRIDGREKKGRLGVAQDASAHGILLNTCSRFTAADEVELTLLALPNAAPVKARLVRVEVVGRDSSFPWRYLAAAVFDRPVPELESVLSADAAATS